MGLSFHWRIGSSTRARKRFSCSFWPTSSQIFRRRMPPSTMNFSVGGQRLEEPPVLLGRAEAHDVFDAGPIVPAAVEDHDLARRREMLDIALHVHLALLAVRRRWQRDDAEHPRADAFGDRLDGATLAGGVTPLEHDDDARALGLHPGLKVRTALPGAAASPSRRSCGRVSRHRGFSTYMPPDPGDQPKDGTSAGDWLVGTVTKRRSCACGRSWRHLPARHTMR